MAGRFLIRIWTASEHTFLRMTHPQSALCWDCGVKFQPNERVFRYMLGHPKKTVFFCSKCFRKRISAFEIHLPKKELMYIAGILDACGTIEIDEKNPRSRQPHINVVDKKKALIQYLCNKLGTTEKPMSIPSVSEWKAAFQSVLKCGEIAKTLGPYMKFKAKHMLLMAEFCDLVIKRYRSGVRGRKTPYPREGQIYVDLKKLNARLYSHP